MRAPAQTGASETTSQSDSPTRYTCVSSQLVFKDLFLPLNSKIVFASKFYGPNFAPHNEIRSDGQDEAYLV